MRLGSPHGGSEGVGMPTRSSVGVQEAHPNVWKESGGPSRVVGRPTWWYERDQVTPSK